MTFAQRHDGLARSVLTEDDVEGDEGRRFDAPLGQEHAEAEDDAIRRDEREAHA